MKYLIECSFGEIIDKISILRIKLDKVTNKNQEINIKNEYDKLIKYKTDDETLNYLYEELYEVNKTLWNLEDNIRLKSSKEEFDKEYINIANSIHIYNDKRYQIKNRINNLFDSDIKEEKIYNLINNSSKNSGNKKNFEVNVINLEYRKEKMEKIVNSFTLDNFTINRYNAIEGKNVNVAHNNLTNGQIGCFMSHMNLWQKCLDEDRPYIVIAEDDIILDEIFSYDILNDALTEIKNFDWDILFLGKIVDHLKTKDNMGMRYGLDSLSDKYNRSKVYQNIKENDPRCGLFFYIMSQNGCRKCINLFSKLNTITSPVDVFIWYVDELLNSFTLNKGLADVEMDTSDTSSLSLAYDVILYLENEMKMDVRKSKMISPKLTKREKNVLKDIMKNCTKPSNERKLEELIKKYEDWYLPKYYLSKFYITNNNYEIASEYFKKTVELNKTNLNINIEYASACGHSPAANPPSAESFINQPALSRLPAETVSRRQRHRYNPHILPRLSTKYNTFLCKTNPISSPTPKC